MMEGVISNILTLKLTDFSLKFVVAGCLMVIEILHENLHEKLIVTDIPIKNWVNAIIRVTNNVIDLYINGRLAQRIKTAGIPLQNYGNVNIGEAKQGNRFSGYISTIQYFNYSIGSSKIKSIVDEGPIMKMVSNTGAELSTQNTNYLSNNWFLR